MNSKGQYFIRIVDASICFRKINICIGHGLENIKSGSAFYEKAEVEVLMHRDNVLFHKDYNCVHVQKFVNEDGNADWGPTRRILSKAYKIIYKHGKPQPSHHDVTGANDTGEIEMF
jgi:hypothetical protein